MTETPGARPSEPTQRAAVTNRDAGDYPVTTDPLAREAAQRAIGAIYAEFPYYAQRYGERGRAFATTDSGWLVTLTDLDIGAATDEVLWLCRVLAARGMPRLLMERHLARLADELDEVRPSDHGRWELLRALSGVLAERRRAVQPEATLTTLDRDFEAAVRAGADAADGAAADRLPHTGMLLAAAVADERDGVPNAVAGLVEWLTDPARFGAGWIRAVTATVSAARG